jgi:hypothetical protein
MHFVVADLPCLSFRRMAQALFPSILFLSCLLSFPSVAVFGKTERLTLTNVGTKYEITYGALRQSPTLRRLLNPRTRVVETTFQHVVVQWLVEELEKTSNQSTHAQKRETWNAFLKRRYGQDSFKDGDESFQWLNAAEFLKIQPMLDACIEAYATFLFSRFGDTEKSFQTFLESYVYTIPLHIQRLILDRHFKFPQADPSLVSNLVAAFALKLVEAQPMRTSIPAYLVSALTTCPYAFSLLFGKQFPVTKSAFPQAANIPTLEEMRSFSRLLINGKEERVKIEPNMYGNWYRAIDYLPNRVASGVMENWNAISVNGRFQELMFLSMSALKVKSQDFASWSKAFYDLQIRNPDDWDLILLHYQLASLLFQRNFRIFDVDLDRRALVPFFCLIDERIGEGEAMCIVRFPKRYGQAFHFDRVEIL